MESTQKIITQVDMFKFLQFKDIFRHHYNLIVAQIDNTELPHLQNGLNAYYSIERQINLFCIEGFAH